MNATEIHDLPYVDTHTAVVDAGADVVWRALGDVLERSFPGRRRSGALRLLGVADRTASGPRPLAEGSTLGGFRVAAAEPPRELTLVGSHRFSSYALVFRLEEAGPARTRLRAETRARFPGPAGAVYRALVIGSGAHRAVVRRLLNSVRESAPEGRGAA
ncbi:hypothetical protein RKD23_006253 [Streptomyces sp. SAI-170]|uniref:SRPBCC family protein n=1 Tax=Streptomyces sp. SAI-170 TaxID=3377729 RepID=UPI003C7E1480